MKGTGAIKLMEQPDHKTLMQYSGDVQIGGRLASVGQRLVESVSKSMVKQGLETLNAALQAKHAPPPPSAATPEARTPEPVPMYTPPSEMKFAMGVAKDLTTEFFSTTDRNTWLVVAVVLVSFALGYCFGQKRRDG